MSLTCEISGEPLAFTKEATVATPSGHVCLKRLLLQKLTENGGMDPFEITQKRPLSEDSLIELQRNLDRPPRPQAASVSTLLQLLQNEYDALVLELFDTRKALEDTRRQLSQALYQNDSATRVVARLAMERDAARDELERWNASAEPVARKELSSSNGVLEAANEPQAKRQKVERPGVPLTNDLAQVDSNVLEETWRRLHTQRKPMLKAAAAHAPTVDQLATFTNTGTGAWHEATCRSVVCIASRGDLLMTGGIDKQIVLYSNSDKVVKFTLSLDAVATCLDVYETVLAVAVTQGRLFIFSATDGSALGCFAADETEIVAVNLHPSEKYLYVVTADGRLLVGRIESKSLNLIAEFKASSGVKYTCGAMHPDGLLMAAGTSQGEVHVWDLKSKILAATLQDGVEEDAVTTIAFSQNGYHLAAGNTSAFVRFWDLRKQKSVAMVNEDGGLLDSITCIAFDESAKYVALGGNGGLAVIAVKGWSTTASISVEKPISGLAWMADYIVTCSDKDGSISFFGAQ